MFFYGYIKTISIIENLKFNQISEVGNIQPVCNTIKILDMLI